METFQPGPEEKVDLVLPPLNVQFENVHYDDGNNVISWEPPNPSWNPWISQPTVVEGAEEYMVGYLS